MSRDSTPAAASDRFHLESWPFYWLARVSGLYLQRLEAVLKAIDLDIPRWRVLMQLQGSSAASVSQLADHAIIKLPTMTRIVQRMQADGLVECGTRKKDARVTEVRLTAAGRAARKRAWATANPIYEQIFAGTPREDIDSLVTQLRWLFAKLDAEPRARRTKPKPRTAGRLS